MSPARWAKNKELFERAMYWPPEQALRLLREACNGDDQLYREIEPLVREHFRFEASTRSAGENLPLGADAITSSALEELWKGRFQVVAKIGSGTFGDVYEVIDKERDETVALKILRETESAGLWYFKREFRSLADLRHPNLVRLHELIWDGFHWMFTMELIRGMNWLDLCEDALMLVKPTLRIVAKSVKSNDACGLPCRSLALRCAHCIDETCYIAT